MINSFAIKDPNRLIDYIVHSDITPYFVINDEFDEERIRALAGILGSIETRFFMGGTKSFFAIDASDDILVMPISHLFYQVVTVTDESGTDVSMLNVRVPDVYMKFDKFTLHISPIVPEQYMEVIIKFLKEYQYGSR